MCHSWATGLLASGVAPLTVMEMAGWKTLKMLMDTYGHVIPAQRRDAADALGRLFG